MIPVQKHFPPERLRYMRKVMKSGIGIKEANEQWLSNWKLSQQRQSWWYAAIGLPALGLIVGLLVAGGCR